MQTRYYCLTIKLDLQFIVDLAMIVSFLFLVSIFDEHHIYHMTIVSLIFKHSTHTNTLTEIFIIYCHCNRFDFELKIQAFIIMFVEFHGRLQTKTHKNGKHTLNCTVKPNFLLLFLRESEKSGKTMIWNEMNCKL